jgi:riboflavin kinase/FMN adenylyltransferase
LGRPYQIKGTVVKGKGRGTRLSFPTANLELGDPFKLIPGDGIYAVHIELDNTLYDGAVSIGVRPTFNEREKTIEAYIFDFNQTIYGQKITIKFIKKIRDEIKFETENELISQMKHDVIHAKTLLEQV